MTTRTHTILTTAILTGFVTACVFFFLGVYACDQSIRAEYELRNNSGQLQEHR